MRGSRLAAALGLFLVTAAIYTFASTGRIDIIDGQYRFEVAKNLVASGSVEVRDEFLTRSVPGRGGRMYSPYGLSASALATPLIMFANMTGPISVERQQFFFSFLSAVLGAATAAVLVLFYCALGFSTRQSAAWTLVVAFATLAFPAATTVFDQAQHAFFVLVACLAAFLSARRDSLLWAVLGGCSLFVLVNFQEPFVLMVPTLGVATLAPRGASAADRGRGRLRYALFVGIGCLGLFAVAAFNYYRFGSPLYSGKGIDHPAVFANPLIGLLGLTVSPGKSILLYSPVTIAAALGMRGLVRAHARLGVAVLLASGFFLFFVSTLSFWGGDWCWGPRYFAPVMPLLALGLPWIAQQLRVRTFATLVVVSLAVQLLGISVDHHRFFYARSLPSFFWATDQSFYFHESALFSRPAEVADSIRRGVPAVAEAFRPGPHQELLTYAVFGAWGHPDLSPPQWMEHYRVFWLPRPWPLWMAAVPAAQRPVDIRRSEIILACVTAIGLALMAVGIRGRSRV